MKKIGFDKHNVAEDISRALELLGQEYPFVPSNSGDINVDFKLESSIFEAESKRGYKISKSQNSALIQYSDITSALRGVGEIMFADSDMTSKTSSTGYKTIGIMLDCSRNAVMTVEHFKTWLRRLALLGFNMAMLYTEDTYEIQGQDYFGYLRGRYTAEELREIDSYAKDLGIEMIGCIQTLGHLSQILRWDTYDDVRDTSAVLLAGEPITYELIEKMISHFSQVFSSNRLHIGMDEAWDLGRGSYLDRFGHRRGFDIINEHLNKVVKICEKYNVQPWIWSDMYFRLADPDGGYYAPQADIPPEVASDIPSAVKLVYWDYYHADPKVYTDMIDAHRDKLKHEPVVGSGVWTWPTFWYDRQMTDANAIACVKGCDQKNISELFFTLWGDDGGYCEFNSCFAGLCDVAGCAYGEDEQVTRQRFEEMCGTDYNICKRLGDINYNTILKNTKTFENLKVVLWGSSVLWDDPLLCIVMRNEKLKDDKIWQKALEHYDSILADVDNKAANENGWIDTAYGILFVKLLRAKVNCGINLMEAYKSGDKKALTEVRGQMLQTASLIADFDRAFRRQWLRRNKPEGMEIIQIRLAGLKRRYEEAAERISELLDGKIDQINELQARINEPVVLKNTWRSIASSSTIL